MEMNSIPTLGVLVSRSALRLVIGALYLGLSAAASHAQSYPTQPVKLVVPFPAGGGTDLVARVIARPLSESLGQQVFVDNRPGAGARMGTEAAIRSAPDGYTLLMVSGTYATSPALYKTAYDAIKDITPISIIGEQPLVIAVGPSAPFQNLTELIAYAKANPGKLNYASAGNGSFSHLTAEYFAQEAKIQLTHVPYKGMAPAYNDLMSGIVQLTVGAVVSTLPHLKSGRMRAIAVTSTGRSPLLPDVPAVAEKLPGFQVVSWYGLMGPKGMPPAVVTRLNKEMDKAIRLPEVQRGLSGEGLDLIGGPPSAFTSAIRRDVEKWKRVVKGSNITPDQ